MIDNFFLHPRVFGNDSFFKPPTMYSLLDSILNFENQNPVKTYNLAKEGRSHIFDFDYPLSEKMTKEDFETLILNKFLMRRIGFETLNAFKIQLNVKLNEIMPMYNKLFDALDGWDIFNDGGKTIHTITESTTNTSTSNSTSSTSDSNTSNNSTTSGNTTNTTDSSTSDSRSSDTPQNQITEVQNGSYVDKYQYVQNSGNSQNISSSTGNSNTTSSGSSSTTAQDNITGGSNKIYNETTEHTPEDKIAIYTQFLENKNNIMSLIFRDLDILFYQLI